MTTSEKIPWKRLTAEGVAIVVSILLAFWIDAWWEDREQAQQLVGNLKALEEEIELNQVEINNALEAISDVFLKIDGVFETLANQDAETLDDAFLAAVGDSQGVRFVQTTTSAFDVVVSAENLRLIENAELRSGLVGARQSILRIQKFRQVLAAEYAERLGPFLARSGLVYPMGWMEGQEEDIQSGMLRPLPASPFPRDRSALLGSEFWFMFEHWKMTYFEYVWWLKKAGNRQAEALELLRAELALLTGA